MDYLDRLETQKETEPNLEQLLAGLARSRERLAKAKETRKALLDDFTQQIPYVQAAEAMEYEGKLVDTYESAIRDLAVKTSQPLPKEITVKNFKEAIIFNAEKAREWCLNNFKPAMKMDEKLFKDAIKDGLVPSDLGHVKVEKRAQIATDLSKYLEVLTEK